MILVPDGGDLQAAITNARAGETIALRPGAVFRGSFVLPPKDGTAPVTIRSAAPSLPPPGTRVGQGDASLMPKIQGIDSTGALRTLARAHDYVLRCLEVVPNPAGAGALVSLGSAAKGEQSTLDQVPQRLDVVQCYLHGAPGAPQLRGLALNSGETTIRDSTISEIKVAGQDSQAIGGWNGIGPFTVANCYLEAAGENFMLGGSTCYIPGAVPSLTFVRNHCRKPLEWRGSSWTVKNLFELKHAQDVIVEGNLFEHCWSAAQDGSAILFTPRNQYNDTPWTVVRRVRFTHNIVRHVASVFNILGRDTNAPSELTEDLTIDNCLCEDVSAAAWGGSGRFMLITGARNVHVSRVTSEQSGPAVFAYGEPCEGFQWLDTHTNPGAWRLSGDGCGEYESLARQRFFPGAIVEPPGAGCDLAALQEAMRAPVPTPEPQELPADPVDAAVDDMCAAFTRLVKALRQ